MIATCGPASTVPGRDGRTRALQNLPELPDLATRLGGGFRGISCPVGAPALHTLGDSTGLSIGWTPTPWSGVIGAMVGLMAARGDQWQVDYNRVQHDVYARGRELAPAVIQGWVDAVVDHAPSVTDRVADVGAGVGRFSVPLAEALSASVIAVEPSIKMLERAAAERPHPRVSYVVGRAEQLPTANGAVDVVFLSMVAHHLPDLPLAASELARVAAPQAVVVFRNVFRGRMSDVPLFRYFPKALSIENSRAPAVDEVAAAFEPHGFSVVTLTPVIQETDPNLTAYHERLSTRAVSVFEFLTEEEVRSGLEMLHREAMNSADSAPVREPIDLLVLQRQNQGAAKQG